MINKARVFIVIFLFSMIIGSPFVIKQVIAKKVQEIQSSKEIAEIDNNENSNDNIETVENKEEENKTSNSKKIDIKFEKVDKSYFDDALFIGDSRTEGISEYGGLDNATFFADTGSNIYDIYDTSVSVNNKNVKIEQLLSTNKYGKIYVMMGINELGYNLDRTAKKYEEFINFIKGKQKKLKTVLSCIFFYTFFLEIKPKRRSKGFLYGWSADKSPKALCPRFYSLNPPRPLCPWPACWGCMKGILSQERRLTEASPRLPFPCRSWAGRPRRRQNFLCAQQGFGRSFSQSPRRLSRSFRGPFRPCFARRRPGRRGYARP